MKHYLFIVFLLLPLLSKGQTLQLQAGTSVSDIDWDLKSTNFDLGYNRMVFSPCFLIGLNYLERSHFNLSSNVGYVTKGGKVGNVENQPGLSRDTDAGLYSKMHYITLNTMMDIKFPIYDIWIPYISMGPRVDFLLSTAGEIDIVNQINAVESNSFGLNLGAGVKRRIKQFDIGLRTDYYFNFNSVANWDPTGTILFGGIIKDHTFTVNTTLSYHIPNNPQQRRFRKICKKQWN